MYVCLCKGITDQQIHDAVDQGHNSLEALQHQLEVSTCCGACETEVETILEQRANANPIKSKELFLHTPSTLSPA